VSCDKSQPSLYILLGLDGSHNMEEKPRPYLTAALLCEKVLIEQDGSVSVIRIADRVQLQMQGPPGVGLAGMAMPPGSGEPVPIFKLELFRRLEVRSCHRRLHATYDFSDPQRQRSGNAN